MTDHCRSHRHAPRSRRTCPPTSSTTSTASSSTRVDGDTFDVLDPVSERDLRCRPRPARRPTSTSPSPPPARAFTDGPVAADDAARAVAHPAPDRRHRRVPDARLAELETFDSGLPITQALGQARRAAENFRFFADLIVAQADDAYKVPGAPDQLRQPQADRRRRAHHAVEHAVHARVAGSSAPALATGNTVVLKPAEFTPLSASLWAGDLRGGRAARRACSTSSTASARRPATRW